MVGAKPFAQAYPAPWSVQGLEVVDRDGCNVQDFDDTPEDREFWQGVSGTYVALFRRRFIDPNTGKVTEDGRRALENAR